MWETEEEGELREARNQRLKAEYDLQTEIIIQGKGTPPIAPMCSAEVSEWAAQYEKDVEHGAYSKGQTPKG